MTLPFSLTKGIRRKEFLVWIQKNRNFLGDKIRFESGVSRPMQEILLDPQTSGGMLYSVAPEDVNDVMKELNDLEMPSCVVGEVQERQDKNIIIY